MEGIEALAQGYRPLQLGTSLIHLIDTKAEWARSEQLREQRCARSRSGSSIRNNQGKRVCAICARVRHQGLAAGLAVDLFDFVRTFEPLVTDLTKEQARIMKMRKALQ